MFVAPPSVRRMAHIAGSTIYRLPMHRHWLIELVRDKANKHDRINIHKPLSEAEKTAGCIAIRDHLPNEDDDWDTWNTKGMKIWKAVPDERGREAFHGYSQRSELKYDEKKTDEKWKAYSGSPPTDITDGSFIWLVNEAIGVGWRDRIADDEAPEQTTPETEGVTRADFRAYLPDHSYIFTPTGTFWSMAGVKACLAVERSKLPSGSTRTSRCII